MKETKSEKVNKKPSYIKDLILLFSIPALIALVTAGFVYVPRLMANPQSDFIYSVCPSYSCATEYDISRKDKISKHKYHQGEEFRDGDARLMHFDVSENSYKPISIEDANKLSLNRSSKSPDGYSLTKNVTDNGFLLWEGSSQEWNLQKDWMKKPVTLTSDYSEYSTEIKFLAWTTNEN